MATNFGLDTGSWKLRLAAMEGTFGRFALRDVQEVAVLPEQAGGVPLAEALAALREAEPRWAEADRVAGFPLEGAVVRLVKLPFADRAAIERAIPAEVEAQVPYDLDDMVLVHRIVDTREGASRTSVHLAPRDAVRSRIDTLSGVAAEPRHLVIDAAALAAYADRGLQVVADIGHRRTLLAVCHQGQLLCARVVALGGEAVTAAIAEAMGVDLTSAEEVKHALTLPPPESGGEWDSEERTETSAAPSPGAGLEPEEAARLVAERLIAALRAELIAVEDDLGVGVDELLLAGGGSRLGGFPELLSARLGVAVRPVVVPGGYPVECALAVALARVGTGEVKAPDLRVGDLAFHGAADLLWRVVSLSTLGAAVAMVAGLSLFALRYVDAQSRLSELTGRMTDLVTKTYPDVTPDRVTDPTTALTLMQERAMATNTRVETLGFVISGRPPMLETLKQISERLPPHSEARIDVRELTIGEDALSLKAETDSYDTAAKIETALKQDPAFAGARKSDEKKAGEALTFSMTIPLGATEAEVPKEDG